MFAGMTSATRVAVIAIACSWLGACATAGAAATDAGGEQVVTNYYDGLVVRTANAYGNIETRAMSYGPGACTTHVSAGDKTVSFVAPPATYSSWVVIRSHTGSMSFPISKSDQCSTGTEVQIRYWK